MNETEYQFGYKNVSGELVCLSEKLTLHIGEPANIQTKKPPYDINSKFNSSTFYGSFEGIPPPSISVLHSNGSEIQESLYTNSSGVWYLDSSVSQHGGVFTVSARNCFATSNVSFTVNAKPSINFQLPSRTTCEWMGCNSKIIISQHCQDVIIPFSIQGFPYPRVRWLKYNRQRRQYALLTSNHHVSFNDTHFLLRRAQFSDTGFYRVVINSSGGSDNITFNLQVTENSTLISECQNASGWNVSMDCVTVSHVSTVVHGQITACQWNATTTVSSKVAITNVPATVTAFHVNKEVALGSSRSKSIHDIPETGIPYDTPKRQGNQVTVSSSSVPLWILITGVTSCCIFGVAMVLMACLVIKKRKMKREKESTKKEHHPNSDTGSTSENTIESMTLENIESELATLEMCLQRLMRRRNQDSPLSAMTKETDSQTGTSDCRVISPMKFLGQDLPRYQNVPYPKSSTVNETYQTMRN